MSCLYNTHQFDAAIKVVIFENSLPLPKRQFYRICSVGKDLIILRLRPCCLAPVCRAGTGRSSANSTLAGFRSKLFYSINEG